MARRTLIGIALATLVILAGAWLMFRPLDTADTTPLSIGAVLPLTGSSARYGTWIQEGLQLAVDRVREDGGIHGQPLAIIYEDDQAQPTNAASAMQKLVTVDRVPVVFGSWASSSVLAQAPIAERSKTILMAEAISPQIRDAGDFIFRIQPDARFYLNALIPFIHQTLRAKTASILYINNDFGADQAAVFTAGFVPLGGQVLSQESYLPNTTDFRAQLTKIRGQRPDVLFLPGYAEVGTILRQARELGLQCQFAGSVPTENPDLITVAGVAAEGIVYPSHFDPNAADPAVRTFQRRYQARYGRQAEGFAALAYDGLIIIAEGLRRCERNTSCLRDFLYSTKNYPGVTGATSFDKKGDVVKAVIIKTVRGGRFVAYTD